MGDSISPNRFYVYMFYRNGVPFYVGKGSGERIDQHFVCARKHQTCKHLTCRIIRKENREGGEVTIVKIAEGISELAAFSIERLMISVGIASRWPLVNQTNGGEGVSGYIRDAEWGARRSKLVKKLMTEGKYQHLKTVNKGRRQSEEERKIRSQRVSEAWTDSELRGLKSQQSKQMWESPEYREKHRQAMSNPEVHEKLAYWKGKEGARAKAYKGFVSPNGEVYAPVHNLAIFCREHGLQRSGMCLVAQGKQSQHLGWTRYPPIEKQPTYVGPSLQAPDGTIYDAVTITNLSEFCREHGLAPNTMSEVSNGKRKSHRGWTIYPPPKPTTYAASGFTAPDGTIYTNIPKLRDFCLEHCLGYSEMAHINAGKLLSYKGWTKYPPPENIPSYSFIAPDGSLHTTRHLSALCREHGLNQGSMSEVNNGKRLSHKGWARYDPESTQPSLFEP